jgi:hypothetical protein
MILKFASIILARIEMIFENARTKIEIIKKMKSLDEKILLILILIQLLIPFLIFILILPVPVYDGNP